mmetsp:Transcript_46045/g.109440  ORF Transcript_46045/g.109440 Transcript_46045/m.109440 type:complete len:355 (+) Transcript_46045:2593-3657(+)
MVADETSTLRQADNPKEEVAAKHPQPYTAFKALLGGIQLQCSDLLAARHLRPFFDDCSSRRVARHCLLLQKQWLALRKPQLGRWEARGRLKRDRRIPRGQLPVRLQPQCAERAVLGVERLRLRSDPNFRVKSALCLQSQSAGPRLQGVCGRQVLDSPRPAPLYQLPRADLRLRQLRRGFGDLHGWNDAQKRRDDMATLYQGSNGGLNMLLAQEEVAPRVDWDQRPRLHSSLHHLVAEGAQLLQGQSRVSDLSSRAEGHPATLENLALDAGFLRQLCIDNHRRAWCHRGFHNCHKMAIGNGLANPRAAVGGIADNHKILLLGFEDQVLDVFRLLRRNCGSSLRRLRRRSPRLPAH